MEVAEIINTLSEPEELSNNKFEVLKAISCLHSKEGASENVQELVLRALEHREILSEYSSILDSLVREIGLFPYLDSEGLGIADSIAYEFHAAPNMPDKKVVFHAKQNEIFHAIMSGESVVLSAPTSFGKSLIIDAVIATNAFNNIVIVVPSIALIDETRRRLAKFSNYHIITHAIQEVHDRNIYVLTQERVLEQDFIKNVDFFVIDEFYKLMPSQKRDDRADRLNLAFYFLYKKCKHFYMLGPNIDGITDDFTDSISYKSFKNRYQTVVANTIDVEFDDGGDEEKLLSLCSNLKGQTIIFCSSPQRASKIGGLLASIGTSIKNKELNEFSDWLSEKYHPKWHLVDAVRSGIGVHHGRIPRSISQYIVNLFNNEKIQFLVCTSTLIEGVNTAAKNMILFDNTINRKNIDRFTFNNIAGRCGRIFQHFVGNIYLFHREPEAELPLVDIPVISQSDIATDNLLINIEDPDLKDKSRERLRKYFEQPYVSLEILRRNKGVDLEYQVNFAKALHENYGQWHHQLSWSGFPTWECITFICQLIWDYFNGARLGNGSARSPKQLAFLINSLRNKPEISETINNYNSFYQDIEQSVSMALDFRRMWANLHFPRIVNSINEIQKEIFPKYGLSSGDYSVFTTRVENYYYEASLVALEEYGLPLEISAKFEDRLYSDNGLDGAILRLRNLDERRINLSDFEMNILKLVKTSL